MATTSGRLVILVNKLWRQVIGRNNNNNKIIIPNDIVVEILLRLPAESLLRLRWAGKYWFNLITRDRHFIKMHHLHHSTTTTRDNDNEEIILSILSLTYGTISCWKVNFFSKFHISDRVDIEQLPFKYAKALGSCNGLILLCERQRQPGEENKLCILNPCTKEYRILPRPLYERWHNYYGFVYDHTIDDYKVIGKNYSRIRDDVYSDVQVYTLGTNSWRIIKTKSSRLRNHPFKKGVFVNGSCNYWMDSYRKNIISFDIGKEEEFQDVPKPPNLGDHSDDWHNAKLQVFEGSLCMVIKIEGQQEMWVMKDYTVNNNNNNKETLWTKVSTIPYPHPIKYPPRKFHPIKPLRYTRNGEILMLKNKMEFILYKPNYSEYITLGSMGEYLTYNYVEEVYTESLVSLNSGTYTNQEQKKKKKMRSMMAWL